MHIKSSFMQIYVIYDLLDKFLLQLRKSAPYECEILYNKSDP